jgi:hypothetical protein
VVVAFKNTSSSIKKKIRLNLNTGELTGPYLQPGKEHDKSSKLMEREIPYGSLRIADLGYFSLSDFKDYNANGVYWLSRVKSQCDVYYLGNRFSLFLILEYHCNDKMDITVFLGAKERVPCRLISVKIEDKVAKVRRCNLIKEAQRKGKKVSDKSLKLASWIILCCNVPYEMLNMNDNCAVERAVALPRLNARSMANRTDIQALERTRLH